MLDDLGELDVSTEFDCIETRECGGTERRASGVVTKVSVPRRL